MRRPVVGALAAGGLLCVTLGACGSSAPALETQTVARAVETSIRSQLGVATTVRCPTNVPRRAGASFTCVAHLDVGAYPVAVSETDDRGHVTYGNQAPLVALDVARVQRSIASSILAQRHLHATVLCPTTILQHAGLRFTCTATVAHRSYPFEVTEIDAVGHVRYVGR